MEDLGGRHLTSRAAAQAVEATLNRPITVQKWHRLTVKHGVAPVMAAPGLRGAKFWDAKDVEWIARLEATTKQIAS